jgi:hypothetical protein
MKESVEIICLSCDFAFKIEFNGHSLAMHDRDHSIRYARSGKKIHCPKCERKQLIFKGYEKPK